MLKEHNQEAYEAIKKMLKAYKECCIVAATGIGKSNIVTELLRDLQLNAMIIVPNKSLEDEWNKIYEKYDTEYFSIVTYHYFNLHYKTLYGFDAYIFDEAHHMGAKEWGKAIKNFKSELIDELFIGATADDNRYFDEDIKTVVNTFFNKDHIVYGLNQRDAIEKGILPRAKYVCAIYNVEEAFAKYKTIELTDELRGKLNYTIQNCKSIESILQENIPNNSPTKGIVFVDNIKNIDVGVDLVKRAFPNEQVCYIHSKLSNKTNERILKEFRMAKSGFIVSVDKLNEGNHIEGINTIIMLRKTSSPSLYTQQIGRGLAAGGDNVTIFDFIRNDTSIKKVLKRIKNTKAIYYNDDSENEDNNTRSRDITISNQFIVEDKASDILEIFDAIEEYINGNKYRKWTKEEDDILREYYPSMGIKVCTKLPGKDANSCVYRAGVLNIHSDRIWTNNEDNIIREYYPSMGSEVYTKLPGRTKNACIARAKLLNIVYSERPKKWTEEEDNIIREYYPSMGAKVYTKLPGRTKNACSGRARILLSSNSDKRIEWTEEEDNIIRKYYPSMGSKVYTKLPGRTDKACNGRAMALNVKKQSNKWTKEEDDILREYYPSMGSEVYTKLPGRTYQACRHRATTLQIKTFSNNWTEEEDNIIREYYPSMGAKVYTKLPGRTYKACRGRAKALQIKTFSNNWTEEEDNIIREYYPSMGAKEVSKIIGRSKSSCINRALILGIKYSNNNWTKEEDNILREYYPSMGSKVSTKLPGRSANSCIARANLLKIEFAKYCKSVSWSEEEDNILREYYPSMGSKVSTKIPGRTRHACIGRAKMLKIKMKQ